MDSQKHLIRYLTSFLVNHIFWTEHNTQPIYGLSACIPRSAGWTETRLQLFDSRRGFVSRAAEKGASARAPEHRWVRRFWVPLAPGHSETPNRRGIVISLCRDPGTIAAAQDRDLSVSKYGRDVCAPSPPLYNRPDPSSSTRTCLWWTVLSCYVNGSLSLLKETEEIAGSV